MNPGSEASAAPERTPPPIEELLRRQEALRSFVESISGELDQRPLLTRIVRHACQLIGADRGAIGLVDPARDLVQMEAIYRMPPEELGREIPAGQGLAGRVLLERRPVIIDRYGDLSAPVEDGRMLNDAVVGVPIERRGELIGFFGIGMAADPETGRPPRRFTREDVETLSIFARHAAIAIENARRYEREQRRTERLELIARVGRIIAGHLALDDLLLSSVRSIHELLGYPNVAVGILEGEDPEALQLTVAGPYYRAFREGAARLPLDRGIMGAAARERRVLLVNDVRSDPRYVPPPGMPESETLAELAIPIVLGEQLVGVLAVESPRPFGDDDVESLRIVADQLAVGIENARLYEWGQRIAILEERNRLARDLHDSVTQQLFGITMLAQSLESALERDPAEAGRRAGRLLELSRAALAEMRALLGELRPGEERAAGPHGDPRAGPRAGRAAGLPAALRGLAEEFEEYGLAVDLDASGYRPRGAAAEDALYRICQEALHNVVKHADASRARVRLVADEEGCRLRVEDDGRGFAPSDSTRSARERPGGHGLGVRTMRERAHELGGRLVIASSPAGGTVVEVRLPPEVTT